MYKIHHANGTIASAGTPKAAVLEAAKSICISEARAQEMTEALEAGAKNQIAIYGFARTDITKN
ncbi:hypothetical protein [Pseudomonas sp. DSV-1]|uniref:hypothetical protein n=1 Tax=Pseudomonas sp. DSV-1 TaxID=3112250 RepID=UPI002DBFBD71|nr:hypothetical protein [Pseudomonas sp. DSV-1]MEC4242082.1 hypothetical protein [Pseudomonas sp. DSV-1]